MKVIHRKISGHSISENSTSRWMDGSGTAVAGTTYYLFHQTLFRTKMLNKYHDLVNLIKLIYFLIHLFIHKSINLLIQY